MMDLFKYLSKQVVITDIDDKVWHGKALFFEPAIDSEDNEDSITIKAIEFDDGVIEFKESEIKSIEVVD